MDPLDETSFRNAVEGDPMSPPDRDSRAERESDPPSGVHRRCGRVLVIEPDRYARGQWDVTAEVHHVEFVSSPKTLGHALNKPGQAHAISIALPERCDRAARTTLVSALGRAGLRGRRIIIDVRRCDLASALELFAHGFILCADDEMHRGSAPRTAVNHATMADELADSPARTRLVRTLAATAMSDSLELSPSEHRAFRGFMDYRKLPRLAAAAALTESTLRSHRRRILQKAGTRDLDDVLAEANQLAFDATFALGRLEL